MANDRNAGRKRKLTPLEEQALYIDYKKGTPRMELAWKYSISESSVYRIVSRFLKQNFGGSYDY